MFEGTRVLSSEEILDEWWTLDKRGKNETVTGRIKLTLKYGKSSTY